MTVWLHPPDARQGAGFYSFLSAALRRHAGARLATGLLPLSFSACMEPLGFEIPKNANGDRLKASFNHRPQCRVRSDPREVSSA